MAELICIFDFDHTLTENNSDVCVPTALGIADKFEALANAPRSERMQWTDMMGSLLRPFPMQRILCAAAESIQVHEGIARAMSLLADLQQKGAKNPALLQVEVCVASDANTVFIEEAFARHFSAVRLNQIHTNLLEACDNGAATLLHWYLPKGSNPCPDCQRTSPNMCKSVIVRRILEASRLRNPVVLYVGDGSNDVCPARNVLRGCDVVAARSGFALARELTGRSASPIAAKVVTWANGGDFCEWLLSFIASQTAPTPE